MATYAASSQASSQNSPYNISRPSGVVEGTYMVAAINNDVGNNGSGIGISGGTTWQSLTSGVSGETGYRLFWKIAGPSEPANYSVSYNTSSTAYSTAHIITSNDAGEDAPVWQITTTTGQGTSGPTPGITPPDPTTLEVRFILASNDINESRSWSPPAGLTERTDIQESGWPSGSSATRTLSSGSATSSLSFTANGQVLDRVGITVGIPSAITDQDVIPSGIASAEAFGTPRIIHVVAPSAIPSGETFGHHVVSTPEPQAVFPDGIVSGETFGTLTTKRYLGVSGIPTGEAWGAPRLSALISPTGIPSAEAFGTTNFGVEQFPAPTGIASRESWGVPVLQLGYPQTVIPLGIPSGERMTQQPRVVLRYRLTLRPPSVQETPAGQNILHARYGVHRGISIIQRADGSIYSTRYPALTDLEAASRYWLGGYAHAITAEEAEALTEAGFGSYIHLEEVA